MGRNFEVEDKSNDAISSRLPHNFTSYHLLCVSHFPGCDVITVDVLVLVKTFHKYSQRWRILNQESSTLRTHLRDNTTSRTKMFL